MVSVSDLIHTLIVLKLCRLYSLLKRSLPKDMFLFILEKEEMGGERERQ